MTFTNKRYWYCQRDGGQWNVPVTLEDWRIVKTQKGNVHLSIIRGSKLISPCCVNGEGWLIIESEGQLFDQAQ